MTGRSNELDSHLAVAVNNQLTTAGVGTVTPDLQDGGFFQFTGTGATVTIAAPLFRGGVVSTDVVPVGTMFIVRVKGPAGGITPTFNAVFKMLGSAGAIAASSFRCWIFVWDGTNWCEVAGTATAADVAN